MEINQIHKNVVLTVDPITNVVNIEVTQVISPPVILEVSEVGRKGDQGSKGDAGVQGIQGVKGDQGSKGDAGVQGIQGVKGDQGSKGDAGVQGIQGVKGDQGSKGDAGVQGIQGVKGDTGNDGLSAYQIAINNGTFTGTEVEFAIMQASVANKLDKGGYQGTAQDLSDSIQNIYQPDTVIRYTAPTRVGNTFTFPSGGYDVLLSKQFHTNVSQLETTIAAATDGFKRIDLIYYKADDTIAKIEGNESATVAVRPEVPAGGIELCLINVFGATIEVPEVNGAYVQKSERANVVLTGSGVINQLNLVDEKATIVFKGSITRLNTISYASVPYNGKRITLFNAQATPVTIGHSVSGYGVDFVFSDAQDYILLPNQTIEFSFDTTYAPYAHHMFIGSKGITNWSELQGKPSTFPPSSHTHVVSEITDFPTFKTIEGQSVIGAGNIDLDKNSVGLGNVDNTSDLNKTISTATQTALNAKANISGQVFTGAVSATNLSGTNTGDNAPNSLYSGLVTNATHTGEVTGSTALTITNGAVTNAKLANVPTGTLKGRMSADTGVVETLTASQARTVLNVANGANNYVHPAKHPASIITQDASNRFVTDTEKSAWNAKEPAIASGTISQYWRGDKTWQEFPTIQTIDNIPTDGSNNAVSSNGVFDALATKAPISSVHNPVTLGTANGLSLATQQLSLGLASSSTTGALSGTDWNTFNNKENAFSKNTAFNKPFGITAGTVVEGGTLGSNAYSSTAYLPLSGGTLTGILNIDDVDSPVIFFRQNSSLISLVTNNFGIYGTGSKTDFNTFVYGNNPYGIWTNGVRRVTVGGDGDTTFSGTISSSPATTANQVVVKSQLDAESDSQIEISANSNTLDAWNKQTILFIANCTITVPATLLPQFGFVFRTLVGVTVTWAITAPFTWETTPTTTPEKTTGSFMRRGSTNTILLDF